MDVMFLYPQALGRQQSSEMRAGISARTPELPQDLGEQKRNLHPLQTPDELDLLRPQFPLHTTRTVGQPHSWGVSQALLRVNNVIFA